MKRRILASLLTPLILPSFSHAQSTCLTDSVEMAAFSAADGNSGLQLAWKSAQDDVWVSIGQGVNFVNSDFGPWGSHKKMFAPVLTCDSDGMWELTWIADPAEPVLASATTSDFISWSPQSYRMVPTRITDAIRMTVNGREVDGTVRKVPMALVSKLTEFVARRDSLNQLYAERMADDAERFAGLQSPVYKVSVDRSVTKSISDKLIGVFFEDINYAADGGLYGELIQNRDFEYSASERPGDAEWNSLTAWRIAGDEDSFHSSIDTIAPIHLNNPHYLHLVVSKPGVLVINTGYDGINIKGGEDYDFSMRIRGNNGAKFRIELRDSAGDCLGEKLFDIRNSKEWQTVNLTLTSMSSSADAEFAIEPLSTGTFDIDMVSLFPVNTFKGRKNGLRADLAQALADLHPRFVRFPGGCVAHGDGVDNIYDWKGSIGTLEARRPLRNLWGYHQTRGLGYHEYFLFCEDIGAEPVPVLAAGVPCQNSGRPGHHSHDAVTSKGQQGGLPMAEMEAYIGDILDLIEYANGDTSTVWGSKRAAAGHPEPFYIKYIGIGNEDMITDVFTTRFKMIYDSVRTRYPEITVIGTVGPFHEGTDYREGWTLARQLDVPMVDEHYYVSPGWLIYNQDYYDSYPREATQVYLGEYASHRPDRASTIETALTEAVYLTSVERNGDVVSMTSYAPLLAKDNHTQWRPDLIYFSNSDVRPTVDYYVQQLFGQNSASCYLPANVEIDSDNAKVVSRIASSVLWDERRGEYIVKLVNLLPVEVNTSVSLPDTTDSPSIISGTLLMGHPDADDSVPQSAEAMVDSQTLSYSMPPYSLSVWRVVAKPCSDHRHLSESSPSWQHLF